MLAHTIECMWERRVSMFPVLDTNLWVQAMEEKQCNTFLKGKTEELHRDIVCTPDFGLNSELDNFKVSAQWYYF